MKTFTLLLLVGVTTAQNETQTCDMGAIMGTLLPNGTTWHDSCAAATGVDVFQISTFPTKDEAKIVQQSRDCVNYINQLNQQANTAIQCDMTIGDQTIAFASLLTDLLKGESSNKTKKFIRTDSMSGSMSGGISILATDLSSDSTSTSEAGESTTSTLDSGEEVSSTAADAQEDSNNASMSSASVATTSSFTIVVAAAITVLAFAL